MKNKIEYLESLGGQLKQIQEQQVMKEHYRSLENKCDDGGGLTDRLETAPEQRHTYGNMTTVLMNLSVFLSDKEGMKDALEDLLKTPVDKKNALGVLVAVDRTEILANELDMLLEGTTINSDERAVAKRMRKGCTEFIHVSKEIYEGVCELSQSLERNTAPATPRPTGKKYTHGI